MAGQSLSGVLNRRARRGRGLLRPTAARQKSKVSTWVWRLFHPHLSLFEDLDVWFSSWISPDRIIDGFLSFSQPLTEKQPESHSWTKEVELFQLHQLNQANWGKCLLSCPPMTGPTQRSNTRKSFKKSIVKSPDPTWGCATGAWWCCWPRRGLSAPSASWPSPWAPTTGSTPAGCVAPRARTTTRLSGRTRKSWPTRVCGGPAAPRVGKDDSRCLGPPHLDPGWSRLS